MATCKACNGEGRRLGPYKGVAGCETEEIVCADCDGKGQWCSYCGESTPDGGPCSDECARAIAADVANDIAMEEQRAAEVSP